MSNIPATALASALIPVQRSAHEALRARKMQSEKNSHHHEDVAELDDTAVNSVHDQEQQSSRQKQEAPEDQRKEQVDIESLKNIEPAAGVLPQSESHFSLPAAPINHLDISA